MKRIILFCCAVSLCLISCVRDNNNEEFLHSDQSQKMGRFDTQPFSWDVSTIDKDHIFVGDNSTKAGASGVNPATGKNISVNSSTIYPGAVYPLNRIENFTFDSEVNYDKNPYDLIFSFSNPYVIEGIDSPKGFTTYNNMLSQAVTSKNFNDYINSGVKKSVDYSATECYSYSDVQKALSFNVGLGTIFTTKMSQNTHTTKYKSIYFARLVATSFDVIFEPSKNGFFKSPEYNNDAKTIQQTGVPSQYFTSKPYFTKQVTYGKYAYLAIESEYSYEKVKSAIEATFNIWKVSGGGGYNQETTEILSKSVVTVMTTGDKSTEPFWGNSLDNLYSMFNVKFDSNFYGYPIFTQMRSVATDETLELDNPTSVDRAKLVTYVYKGDKRWTGFGGVKVLNLKANSNNTNEFSRMDIDVSFRSNSSGAYITRSYTKYFTPTSTSIHVPEQMFKEGFKLDHNWVGRTWDGESETMTRITLYDKAGNKVSVPHTTEFAWFGSYDNF
ncbi:Uncharacterised protein [Chryseobacterium nakagawai]|uniref:hemolysin n=1 Tax=Chryseobacterium nakagawai TaxID=1241982 RepID=UPI000F6BAADE|nr:hemolysin [Chryseobacterium nakagawai]VEH22377.1 Uncharacterised protein [Chryseobacterium nakagawai]